MSNKAVHRQPQNILGITQKISSENIFPDEYVFCDLSKGAWRCPEHSEKTPILSPSISNSKQISHAKSANSDLSTFGSQSRSALAQSKFKEIVGEKLTTVNFDFDKYNLQKDAQDQLSSILSKIKGKPVLLLGFTDNVGSERYNDELALNRALSVKQYLQDAGVPASALHTEGNGVCCYLVPNGTDHQRRINRRVEVYLAD